MSLSAGLTLTDLSDYLAPSQLCIKPVTMIEDHSDDKQTGPSSSKANMEIVIDPDTLAYYEKTPKANDSSGPAMKQKKLKKAEITLNDCLACSGCITSAESVLVQMQSQQEVYKMLTERSDLTPVISIAPQSIASLAALHDLSLEQTLGALRLFFKRELGFRLVFDTTFARSISLSENRREFLERRENATKVNSSASIANSTSSPATSSIGPLPILSSACPGWICYAEKTHGELLPFVSNVKSPQAVMGTLVKGGRIARKLGLRPDQIYHVSVMPCYDKKLEASRPDFATPFVLDSSASSSANPVRDVDCVLTTGEVNTMITEAGLTLRILAQESSSMTDTDELDYLPSSLLTPLSSSETSTSSGGYLFTAILSVIMSLPPSAHSQLRLESRKLRSENSVTYTLYQGDQVLVKVAKSYGLHNLHSVVKKLGRDHGLVTSIGAAGRAPPASRTSRLNGYGDKAHAPTKGVEFIEVMACPGGCVNGGGQIKTPEGSSKQRRTDEEGMPTLQPANIDEEDGRILSSTEWVKKVEEKYWGGQQGKASTRINDVDNDVDESIRPFLELLRRSETEHQLVEEIVGELSQGFGANRRKHLLRTSYRALETEEINGLAVVW